MKCKLDAKFLQPVHESMFQKCRQIFMFCTSQAPIYQSIPISLLIRQTEWKKWSVTLKWFDVWGAVIQNSYASYFDLNSKWCEIRWKKTSDAVHEYCMRPWQQWNRVECQKLNQTEIEIISSVSIDIVRVISDLYRCHHRLAIIHVTTTLCFQ